MATTATRATTVSFDLLYEQALRRADADGCEIVGRGWRKSDGAPVYGVNSAKDHDRWYLVALVGHRLICACAGAQHGLYCKHRARVRQRILAEQDTLDAQAQARELAREGAPLHRDNAPFSIWR